MPLKQGPSSDFLERLKKKKKKSIHFNIERKRSILFRPGQLKGHFMGDTKDMGPNPSELIMTF